MNINAREDPMQSKDLLQQITAFIKIIKTLHFRVIVL